MDLRECKTKRLIKEVSLDEELIKSLIVSSANKINSSKLLPIQDVTTSSIISLAYDGLREFLEALALRNGLKIYNHECYVAFLKEVVNHSLLGDEFDEIRKLRNAINYYGKKIDIADCKQVLIQIIEFLKKIKEL